MYTIKGYKLHSGKIPIFDFIHELELTTQTKIARVINYLQVCGYSAKMPHVKRVNTRLYELRIRGNQEIRIFYTINKEEIILLHGFIKKTNKIPGKEIVTAQVRLAKII